MFHIYLHLSETFVLLPIYSTKLLQKAYNILFLKVQIQLPVRFGRYNADMASANILTDWYGTGL